MNAQTKMMVGAVATVTAAIVIAVIARQGFAWTNPTSAPPLSTPAISVSATGVGIGTATPAAKLEVSGSSLGSTANSVVEIQRFRGLNSNVNSIDIRNIRTSAGTDWTTAGTRIQEKVDATWMGYIQFNGNSNSGGISFGTGLTTTAPGNVGERMRINATGNVGIGTVSPDSNYKLTTSGGGVKAENASATQPAGYFNNTGGGPAITIGTGGISLGGVTQTAWPAGAWTTSGNDIYNSNTGNVGIGATTPIALLDVKNQLLVRDGSYVEVKPGAGQFGLVIRDTNSNAWGNIDANDGYLVLGYGNDNGPLVVTGSNVGIGTAAPGGALDVNGRAAAQSLKVASTFADLVNNAPWYGIGNTNLTLSGAAGPAVQAAGYYGLNFQTAGGQMVLNQTGNMGIGTASPATLLDVKSQLLVRDGEYVEIKPGGSMYGLVIRDNDSSNWGNIDTSDGNLVLGYGNASGPLYISTGSVGIGAPPTTQRLNVGGDINVTSGDYYKNGLPAMKCSFDGRWGYNDEGGSNDFAIVCRNGIITEWCHDTAARGYWQGTYTCS